MTLGWEPIWRNHGARWELQEPETLVVDLVLRLKSEDRTRVLDLGCGLGRHLLLLAAEGFDAVGSDVSPTALETCRRRLREAGLPALVTRSDMSDIPLRNTLLDAVIAWHVLYHTTVEGMDRAIAGVLDRLNPGGLLLATFISTADGQYAGSRDLLARGDAVELEPATFRIPGDTTGDKALPHHYTTEREIRERLLDGFEIEWLREDRRRTSVHWQVLARKPVSPSAT